VEAYKSFSADVFSMNLRVSRQTASTAT